MKSFRFKGLKAFTLIELLIVIVIIGVLATSLIPRIKGIQDKARYTRVEKDFQDFKTAVFMAQSNTGKPLKDITGSAGTHGPCHYEGIIGRDKDLRIMSPSGPCRTQWKQALRRIEQAAGLQTGALAGLETDPWGSPYLLDENENDVHGCNAFDTLHTVGPDGFRGSMSLVDARLTTGDNRGINIIPFRCPGAY